MKALRTTKRLSCIRLLCPADITSSAIYFSLAYAYHIESEMSLIDLYLVLNIIDVFNA